MINPQSSIHDFIHKNKNRWLNHRRTIHSYPEVGWTEFVTTTYIISQLQNISHISLKYGSDIHSKNRLGLPNNTELSRLFNKAAAIPGIRGDILNATKDGYTGVIATIKGELEGGVKCFRSDIDALPIIESKSNHHKPYIENFSSANHGVMHACGHDVHTAIGLAVAETLSGFRSVLRGTVMIIFQPAEEGTRGASSMLEAANWIDTVEEFYGLHVGVNATELGQLIGGWCKLLATKKLEINFLGKSAHAAINPEDGKDALAAACEFVHQLYKKKYTVPNTIIHVGKINGGQVSNIIADLATIKMETRAFDTKNNEDAINLVMKVLDQIKLDHSINVEINVLGESVSADSDKMAAQKVLNAATHIKEFKKLELLSGNFQASDDIALWMRAVQNNGGIASYIGIGTPTITGHHSPTFDIDETLISTSVELVTNLLLN